MSLLYDLHNSVFQQISANKSLYINEASYNDAKKIFTIEFIKCDNQNKTYILNFNVNDKLTLTFDNETVTVPINKPGIIIHHVNEYIKHFL